MEDMLLKGKKEKLKELRSQRAGWITATKERMNLQRKIINQIKTALTGGELTVPELSSATGIGSSDVLWYIATLKAYGEIEEGTKDGSYFKYRLKTNAQDLGPKKEEL